MIEELIDLLEEYCRARPTCNECPFMIEHKDFRFCCEEKIVMDLKEEVEE